jgi:hypothetical protein
MYGLKTPAAEVTQALLIVMRRGSLRAAEEITGHKYKMISAWLKRADSHAGACQRSTLDEFWSFVPLAR